MPTLPPTIIFYADAQQTRMLMPYDAFDMFCPRAKMIRQRAFYARF